MKALSTEEIENRKLLANQACEMLPRNIAIMLSDSDYCTEWKKHISAPEVVAEYIDHTLLKPDCTETEVQDLCAEAKRHSFASVCIPPTYVATANKILEKTEVKICTVVGFPLGYHSSKSKLAESYEAIAQGADEIDMVINISYLKNQNYQDCFDDIKAIADICHAKDRILKVILETSYLTNNQKIIASLISKAAGADFIKTSTGFSSDGAKVDDISMMRFLMGKDKGVKASGGIRDFATAKLMLENGANRLGCSASLNIIGAASVVKNPGAY